jgi:hypothetical protein
MQIIFTHWKAHGLSFWYFYGIDQSSTINNEEKINVFK